MQRETSCRYRGQKSQSKDVLEIGNYLFFIFFEFFLSFDWPHASFIRKLEQCQFLNAVGISVHCTLKLVEARI